MKQELTVQGTKHNISVIPNIGDFLAEKAGVTLPARAKGDKRTPTKDVIVLCEAAGATKDQIKLWRKDLDDARKAHYVQSGIVIGMLAADPSVRKNIKVAVNSKGQVIGANATFRKERSAATSLKAENAQLKAQLAKLLATIALPA